MDSLDVHNIPLLPWQSQSPDMNPVQHGWDFIGRQAWNTMHVDYLLLYIHSMKKRCQAVLDIRDFIIVIEFPNP